MSFSSAGRQIKILRENYLEPKLVELNEKLDYLITIAENSMSKEELDGIKKKSSKAKGN